MAHEEQLKFAEIGDWAGVEAMTLAIMSVRKGKGKGKMGKGGGRGPSYGQPFMHNPGGKGPGFVGWGKAWGKGQGKARTFEGHCHYFFSMRLRSHRQDRSGAVSGHRATHWTHRKHRSTSLAGLHRRARWEATKHAQCTVKEMRCPWGYKL